MYQFIKMDQHLNWHRFACMCAGVFFQAYLSKNSFIHCLFVKVGIYFGNSKCFDCSFWIEFFWRRLKKNEKKTLERLGTYFRKIPIILGTNILKIYYKFLIEKFRFQIRTICQRIHFSQI